MAHHFILLWLTPSALWRLGGVMVWTLCFIACQQGVLKTFPGPGILHSEDGVVWLWHFLVNLHIYGSPFYPAVAQSQCLMTNGRDSDLSTLFHSWRFACQQRLLKIFPGPGYLFSKDRVVWLWHFLVNLHIFIYI